MPAKKRPAKKAAGQQPAKRPARAARRSDDPVWCTTDKKSPLVHEDLHAKYADPQTYANWTKEDWEELREDGLPEDAPYSEDGYSVPITYFKYNSDWRRLVREFQEDLEAGRYEPSWQEAAAEAMEERACGKFDKYKEDEFESFWGQKQKLQWHALAGEATNIKLQELVENSVLRLGDCISYTRAFTGLGSTDVLIEKEAKIVKVEGKFLTLAIPPRQLKYARLISASDQTVEQAVGNLDYSKDVTATTDDDRPPDAMIEEPKGFSKADSGIQEENGGVKNEIRQSPSDMSTSKDTAMANADDIATADCENLDDQVSSSDAQATPSVIKVESSGVHTSDTELPTAADNTQSSLSTSIESPKADLPGLKEDVVLVSVDSLGSLERRIVEVDGRVDAKTLIARSAWKSMRGKRNNQDLGTLFEMREEYYVWKHPKVVKMPKK